MRIRYSLLMSLGAVITAFAIVLIGVVSTSLLADYAAFLSILLVFFILAVLFAKFEESKISSKEVALIGVLAAITAASRIPFAALPNIKPCTFLMAAITAASRIPFAALPNIKPCTFLIIVVGLVFGSLAGAMVGSMTAAVSNMFFGQGPWTPWEMMAWAMVGLVAGYVGKRYPEAGVKEIILLGIILGMAYNVLMDFSSWIVFYRCDPDLLIPTMIAGLPFGLLHIIGNVVFAIILGKPVLMMFRRFQRRFRVTYGANVASGPSVAP
jgi:energy-coupling factor transport system substrate-specific component